METDKEGVETVYKEKELIAIVKRDPHTKKHLVYMVKEATTEDIIALINHKI
jgi:hypothetical protein